MHCLWNCVDFTATGSEMNSGAVVTIEATKEKLTFGGSALFPKFSICDPTVIQSLPKDNCKMVWLMPLT
jgi:alcohol dehydrogenase YqhD (iron-dependent ADH family)